MRLSGMLTSYPSHLDSLNRLQAMNNYRRPLTERMQRIFSSSLPLPMVVATANGLSRLATAMLFVSTQQTQKETNLPLVQPLIPTASI